MEKINFNPELYKDYISRINSVLDYIELNLSEKLTLEELAKVANFSRFHFHRIFYAFLGETLSQFIWRVRLSKAADLLVYNRKKTITEIALDCGFSSSSSFSKSFSNYFHTSPSAWRKEKFSKSNLSKLESNHEKERNGSSLYNFDVTNFKRRMNNMMISSEVKIKDFPETTVAYVRYIGPYKGDENLFEGLFNKLSSWAGPKGLLGKENADFLIIYHDNPDVTEENKLRVSVCLIISEDIEVNGDIGKMTIPEGRYVSAKFELDSTEYEQAWNYVYGQWLPQSGYVPDDRPCFEFYPTKEECKKDGKKLVYIYVPIKQK
jgi:AraC family transcriptional regulator